MVGGVPVVRWGEGGGVGRALVAAWRESGFVGVADHGIPDALVEDALRDARELFELPEAIKLRYQRPDLAGQRGYTRLGVERARDQQHPDLKEFWHVGREAAAGSALPASMPPNVWPCEVPRFRESQLALYAALERLGNALLAALEPELRVEPGFFARRTARGDSILRSIRYPPLPAAPAQLRAAAHEDIDLITLLVGSHEPGLEIRTRAGDWLALTTLPGTIVVNVGDMLQRLTNGVLLSTTHRVVNPPPPWDARARCSIPFFLHLEHDVVLEPIASCVTPERPARWPEAIRARDYLEERLREIGLRS